MRSRSISTAVLFVSLVLGGCVAESLDKGGGDTGQDSGEGEGSITDTADACGCTYPEDDLVASWTFDESLEDFESLFYSDDLGDYAGVRLHGVEGSYLEVGYTMACAPVEFPPSESGGDYVMTFYLRHEAGAGRVWYGTITDGAEDFVVVDDGFDGDWHLTADFEINPNADFVCFGSEEILGVDTVGVYNPS